MIITINSKAPLFLQQQVIAVMEEGKEEQAKRKREAEDRMIQRQQHRINDSMLCMSHQPSPTKPHLRRSVRCCSIVMARMKALGMYLTSETRVFVLCIRFVRERLPLNQMINVHLYRYAAMEQTRLRALSEQHAFLVVFGQSNGIKSLPLFDLHHPSTTHELS